MGVANKRLPFYVWAIPSFSLTIDSIIISTNNFFGLILFQYGFMRKSILLYIILDWPYYSCRLFMTTQHSPLMYYYVLLFMYLPSAYIFNWLRFTNSNLFHGKIFQMFSREN